MKVHRMWSVVCAALALGGLGLGACGDESTNLEPASQEEIQQDVNDAFDAEGQGEKSQKRFEKESEQAQEDMENALDEAQEQAEGDLENPSY